MNKYLDLNNYWVVLPNKNYPINYLESKLFFTFVICHIPPYKITPKIIDLISKISEAVGSFYAQKELRLHRINRIKTIQGSLAIESNTLTTDQITAILDGKPVIAPINEVQEIRDAIKAYELLETLNPNSLDDLLKVHLTMEAGLIDDAGPFRSGGVGVASGEEIIHYAPPAECLPQLMKDLFSWLNNTEEHPLIKSSIFHYEFEFVHLFRMVTDEQTDYGKHLFLLIGDLYSKICLLRI